VNSKKLHPTKDDTFISRYKRLPANIELRFVVIISFVRTFAFFPTSDVYPK
jgi:hypothetical protein